MSNLIDRIPKRTNLDRINAIINTPQFENALVKYGIDMFEFQATWGRYGNEFHALPHKYQSVILETEVQLFGFAQTYVDTNRRNEIGAEQFKVRWISDHETAPSSKPSSRSIVGGDPNLPQQRKNAGWFALGMIAGILVTIAVIYGN